MEIKSTCIDEIESFINIKISYALAVHERDEHEINMENLPQLGRNVQIARNQLNHCLIERNRRSS